jgi:hypothetical protein
METQETRRSDRIPIELPIVVSGTDCMGEVFLEKSNTTVIARHGAKIVLLRKLVPEQELNIRCLKTGRESDARVVGQTGGDVEKSFYGVELLDPNVDLWGIEFPAVDESASAVGRVLLECLRCHNQELAYLDEFEVEVLETNDYLSRHCKRCSDSSLWKKSTAREGAAIMEPQPAAVEPPPKKRSRNDRKHVRLDLKVEVCIRHPQLGEEVTVTQNVSRGGFRFKSRKRYAEDWIIEAALPYSRGGANIFAPCQIVYAGEIPEEDLGVFGAMYLPHDKVWPGR